MNTNNKDDMFYGNEWDSNFRKSDNHKKINNVKKYNVIGFCLDDECAYKAFERKNVPENELKKVKIEANFCDDVMVYEV